MSYILRSWSCLSPRCAAEFTSPEPAPACPTCGNVRVNWIPGGGHVGGTAKAADSELRALIDVFKLPDINSAERGRGAKKIASQPVVDQKSGPMHQFAPGFATVVQPGARAMCVPSQQKVDFKAKLGTGVALGPGKLGLPGVQAGTAIEASHRPPR
jgi:hypothetical protein